MLISCWKDLGSLEFVPSNTLLNSFDGRSFCLHGIFLYFKIKLVGKALSMEIKVVDAPLDYNLLLGRSWTYAMCAIPSSIFWVILFPCEGKLVIVDQLTYTQKGHLETTNSIITLIYYPCSINEILGDMIYTSLMWTFDIPAPINYLGLTSVGKNITTIVDRIDLWVLPSQEEPQVPLLAAQVTYQAIFDAIVDSIMTPPVLEESDEAYFLAMA